MENNPNPKKEVARKVVSLSSGGLQFVGRNIGRLMPRGIRHPDSLITQGPNRSLFLPGHGQGVSVLPGVKPNGLSKSLLVGTPRPTPKRKKSRGRQQAVSSRRLRLF